MRTRPASEVLDLLLESGADPGDVVDRLLVRNPARLRALPGD